MKTETGTVGNGNLIPFQKGHSGNPNGRPKKEFSITEGIREYMGEDDPDRKKARKDILVEKVVAMALRGDKEMIKYTIDRLEGSPRGSAGDTNLNLQINNIQVTQEQLEHEAVELLKSLNYKVEKIEI